MQVLLLLSVFSSAALASSHTTPNSPPSYNVSSCVGYKVQALRETSTGFFANLKLMEECNAFGNDIKRLVLNVSYDTQERLHVHIYDQPEEQYQIPNWLIPRPNDPVQPSLKSKSDLAFHHNASPFEFWITRRSTSEILFDTRAASLPVYDYVIPASDLGEAPFVDSISDRNNTALPSYPFVFEQQYIQIATSVPKDANIYGLGYAVSSSGFRRNNKATVQPNWAADRGDSADSNIYSSFPFYVEHRISEAGIGSSHGVFLMSSEGMDIILREGVIEYRIVGGTLDLTFMSGPSPTAVVQQYSELSGKSQLPPLYALGFNLCRWGYANVTETQAAVDSMRAANIPLETMWNDIDWMHAYRDYVPDPVRFAPEAYGKFVNGLHANNQHYVMIIDAAINLELNATDRYDTYASGKELDVYMKNPDGSEYIGQVWPGATAFPDWFAPNTQEWWTEAFRNFSEIVDFDGVWLDMNEVSSFCLGSCFSGPNANLSNTSTPFLLPGIEGNPVTAFPEGYNSTLSGMSGNITVNGILTYKQKSATSPANSRRDMLRRPMSSGKYSGQASLPESDITYPPYMLHNAQDYFNLGTHAVSPNATHSNGLVELDVHNLWGIMEERATHAAVLAIKPTARPYLISRSLFTSSGIYSGAWGGDNSATWVEMERSIQVILSYQLYNVALIGVDACGFGGNTDEELCNRWMQLGAFSPFFRNHNSLNSISQEPYVWDSVAAASRIAIAARYTLLPYWYTQFAKSHFHGTPVVNALFFVFPNDASLLAVSTQYLVGEDILVSPVLTPNVSSVAALFPNGATTIWRDWWTHVAVNTSKIMTGSHASNVTLHAPLGHIPIHIRGGSVLLLNAQPGYTITDTQSSGYSLLASLDHSGSASGTAYQDDGATYPVQKDGDWFTYAVSNSTLKASAGSGGQKVPEPLKKVTVLGVSTKPSKVVLSGVSVPFTFNSTIQSLQVTGLTQNMNKGFTMTWV